MDGEVTSAEGPSLRGPQDETAVSRLAGLIRSAGSVVALTGAGISVPSGIPDFRSPGTGLWANVDPMEVAHIDVFRRDPERFWHFYGDRFHTLEHKEPNGAHLALAAGADLLLCVGSSLEVYPVAQLPRITLAAGGAIALVTKGPTPYDDEAAVKLGGDVVDELDAVLAALG